MSWPSPGGILFYILHNAGLVSYLARNSYPLPRGGSERAIKHNVSDRCRVNPVTQLFPDLVHCNAMALPSAVRAACHDGATELRHCFVVFCDEDIEIARAGV